MTDTLDGNAYHFFQRRADAAWHSDSNDFAMFTPEGNATCRAMLREVHVFVHRGGLEGDARSLIREIYNQLIEDHPEGRDAIVRDTLGNLFDVVWLEHYGHLYKER